VDLAIDALALARTERVPAVEPGIEAHHRGGADVAAGGKGTAEVEVAVGTGHHRVHRTVAALGQPEQAGPAMVVGTSRQVDATGLAVRAEQGVQRAAEVDLDAFLAMAGEQLRGFGLGMDRPGQQHGQAAGQDRGLQERLADAHGVPRRSGRQAPPAVTAAAPALPEM